MLLESLRRGKSPDLQPVRAKKPDNAREKTRVVVDSEDQSGLTHGRFAPTRRWTRLASSWR
jgi:hypothetical protein